MPHISVPDPRHFAPSPAALDEGNSPSNIEPLPLWETGIIVQTSLRRLRNPLVRYITGDLGSLHPLPEMANAVVPESERQYLRVLRMQGRDRRFSFKWDGAYFEFEKLKALLQAEECGILQWQVLLGQLDSSPQATLEVRLLRAPPRPDVLVEEQLVKRLRTFFFVLPETEHVFRIVFVKDLDGLSGALRRGSYQLCRPSAVRNISPAYFTFIAYNLYVILRIFLSPGPPPMLDQTLLNRFLPINLNGC